MSEAVDRPLEQEQEAVGGAGLDAGRAVLADAARGPRSCPVCARDLVVREYPGSGIAIDECADHGVWLDAGELERIEAYGEGMRRQVAEGAAAAPAAAPVRGLQLPPELIAALRGSMRPGA